MVNEEEENEDKEQANEGLEETKKEETTQESESGYADYRSEKNSVLKDYDGGGMKLKTNRGAIITLSVIMVVSLVAAGVMAWLFISRQEENTRLGETVKTLQNQVGDLEQQIAQKSTEETNVEKETAEEYEFNLNMLQNGYGKYSVVENECVNDKYLHGSPFCISINDDNANEATISVNWKRASEMYPSETSKTDGFSSFEITFKQPVKEVFETYEGQVRTPAVILFLLNDGTVAYTPVVNALRQGDFEPLGTLSGVSNAVAFYRVVQNSNGGGFHTAYQKANGKIYILDLNESKGGADSLGDGTYFGVEK